MAIKINDIPPEGLLLEFDQTLDLFELGTAITSVTAKITIKPVGGGILRVTGRVQAAPQLECSRCLKSFPYPVDAELSVELAPLKTLGPSSEHELVEGELSTEFYQGDAIEPIEIVREQLLIALPMVPIHDQDCKGLCSACGMDLNEKTCGCRNDHGETTGAFSELKNLFKK
jgi:uncharacterized protein